VQRKKDSLVNSEKEFTPQFPIMARRVQKRPALVSSSIVLCFLFLSVVHQNRIAGFTIQGLSRKHPRNNIPGIRLFECDGRQSSATVVNPTKARDRLSTRTCNRSPTVAFSAMQDYVEEGNIQRNQTMGVIVNKETSSSPEDGNSNSNLISFAKRNKQKLTVSTVALLLILIGTVNRGPLLQFLSTPLTFLSSANGFARNWTNSTVPGMLV
jgi:hypothetical protein